MAARAYANLDVVLREDDSGYTVWIAGSPAGSTGEVPFTVPFSPERLELLLMHLEPWRVRTRRVADAPTSAAEELGGALFASLFHGELLSALGESRDRNPDGLRIRLDLSDAPGLAGLPWELLYDRGGRRHLALSERTPVVRYLRLPGTVDPLAVHGPLNILAVLASPSGMPGLDVEAEWEGMRAALARGTAAGLVTLDRLERPTTGDLHRYLRAHEVHVLHLVCHGGFDVGRQDGVVYLEDSRGHPRAVTSGQLGPDLYDHDPLRLVVLNACETASADRTDAFSGLGQGLVQQGVPAVVAMQVPISDEASLCLSRDFYTALAVGQPVDQAITGARKALHGDFGYEWATPVLFLRAPDAVLFALDEALPSAAGSEPHPVVPVPMAAPARRRRATAEKKLEGKVDYVVRRLAGRGGTKVAHFEVSLGGITSTLFVTQQHTVVNGTQRYAYGALRLQARDHSGREGWLPAEFDPFGVLAHATLAGAHVTIDGETSGTLAKVRLLAAPE